MLVKKTKFSLIIPKNITLLYSYKKNIITIIGPLSKKSLKLKLKLSVIKNKKIIIITKTPVIKISNYQNKNIKAYQGTTLSLIKHLLIETSTILYKKLKLIGVGYRAFDVENYDKQILLFKLGYSHSIYFKIPKNLKIFSLKLTKLFIFGNSYQEITQTSSIIQYYKFPEPYKGKGILYENQKIKLKEGKKI